MECRLTPARQARSRSSIPAILPVRPPSPVEVARAFDGCVFITDNREDLGLEEHHRLARAMPRGTGENLFVA